MNKGNEPVSYLRDSGLSLRAKGLLATMLSYPEGRRVTADTWAELSGGSIRTIYNVIKELEKKGYLTQRRCQDNNGYYKGGIIYALYPRGKATSPKRVIGI
ncbi:MAG: helix-turn-helix domain-containing protein [Lachnospiraceae bacterium]|nr:helix-turn-helix domain-containing protein [Lachnospiraceae bacterium]